MVDGVLKADSLCALIFGFSPFKAHNTVGAFSIFPSLKSTMARYD